MVSTDFVAALTEARRRLSHDAWQQLVEHVASLHSSPDADSIQVAMARLVNRDAAWVLSQALQQVEQVAGPEIAAAMVTVDYLAGDGHSTTEVVWTGPASGRFPVRRIDQVLYDLVSAATRRIVLVTFAAYRVPHLCEHLARAVERGVELTLIAESSAESDGQLLVDAIEAFRGVPAARESLYHWPLAQRERNPAGRPGKLHAKCAIVDDVALIGSANLTDDAFNRNMELGILARDVSMVDAIARHFEELIRLGIILKVEPTSL